MLIFYDWFVTKYFQFETFSLSKFLIYLRYFFLFISIACFFCYHLAKQTKKIKTVYFYCLIMLLTATSPNQPKNKQLNSILIGNLNKRKNFEWWLLILFLNVNVCDIWIKHHRNRHFNFKSIDAEQTINSVMCLYWRNITWNSLATYWIWGEWWPTRQTILRKLCTCNVGWNWLDHCWMLVFCWFFSKQNKHSKNSHDFKNM